MRVPCRLAVPLVASLGLVLAVLAPSPLLADDPSLEQLRQEVAALREELARLKAGEALDPRAAELERRIDLLAAEIETLRTGGASEEPALVGEKGLAPAASKVDRKPRGVSIGGYGEALYSSYEAEREDGAPSGVVDQVDFVRQVVYVGYKFTDSILVNSEIEFEHGSTGRGGEVSVEFAYLELQKRKELGLRAGMVLVPMGFLNELHEPPIYRGTRRPEVETAIIPSTWRENGVGLFGEVGPLQWRTYVVASLSSAGFTSAGLRGGRQSGARSRAEDVAFTGRLDFTGVPGLLVGGSFFSGETGQGAEVGGQDVAARVSLFDMHAQYEFRGMQLRALWARSTLADADLVDQQNKLTGAQSVGTAQEGWYAEASFDVMTLVPRGRWAVLPFVRYESLDTQAGVPDGYAEDPARERTLLTAGIELKPIPQVVFKADYQRIRNEARTGTSQWNLAIGYLF
ncbi:MAG TPA: hypothetical protein VGB87_06490 [Vicinamibacteria bacterium]